MSVNRIFTLTQGAVGTTMEFTLSDEDGPVDITGWTVTIIARHGVDDPVIDNGACVLTTPATGQGTYEFNSTTANIEVGEYNLQFKGVIGSDVYYFPTHRERRYGTLAVVASAES